MTDDETESFVVTTSQTGSSEPVSNWIARSIIHSGAKENKTSAVRRLLLPTEDWDVSSQLK